MNDTSTRLPRRRYHVLNRLEQTAKVATAQQIAEAGRLPVETVERYLHPSEAILEASMVPGEIAEPLDRAWSILVHNVDVDSLRHGRNGYARRCRCATCCKATSTMMKYSAAGMDKTTRMHALAAKDDSRVAAPNPVALRHLRRLYAAAGTGALVAEHVGIPKATINYMLRSAKPDGAFRFDHAKKILAVDVATIRAAAAERDRIFARRDAAVTTWKLGTLAALGYPQSWIFERLHAPGGGPRTKRVRLDTYLIDGTVPGWVVDGVDAVFRERSAMVADAERDGIRRGAVAQAVGWARRHDYWPPSAYDDERNIVPAAIPGHPLAAIETRAGRLVDLLELLAAGTQRGPAADRIGIDREEAIRVTDRLGLRYRLAFGSGTEWELDLRASREALKSLRATLDRFDRGEVGVVRLTLDLGILTVATQNSAAVASRNAHPDYIAWKAERDAEKEAVKKAKRAAKMKAKRAAARRAERAAAKKAAGTVKTEAVAA